MMRLTGKNFRQGHFYYAFNVDGKTLNYDTDTPWSFNPYAFSEGVAAPTDQRIIEGALRMNRPYWIRRLLGGDLKRLISNPLEFGSDKKEKELGAKVNEALFESENPTQKEIDYVASQIEEKKLDEVFTPKTVEGFLTLDYLALISYIPKRIVDAVINSSMSSPTKTEVDYLEPEEQQIDNDIFGTPNQYQTQKNLEHKLQIFKILPKPKEDTIKKARIRDPDNSKKNRLYFKKASSEKLKRKQQQEDLL